MAPALEVADIFRRHGEAFRQEHAGHFGGVERRIMGAITACRTAVLGGHVKQCDDCGATRIAYNPCRNRHCPKCHGLVRAQWLAQPHPELLPVPPDFSDGINAAGNQRCDMRPLVVGQIARVSQLAAGRIARGSVPSTSVTVLGSGHHS